MAKMIHSMVRVLNEERSVDFYSKAFSLNVVDRLEFNDFVLVYMSNSETEFELELTINKSQSEPYKLGDGYGHIAFSVSDVSAVHADLKLQDYNREIWLILKITAKRLPSFSLFVTLMAMRLKYWSGVVASNEGLGETEFISNFVDQKNILHEKS